MALKIVSVSADALDDQVEGLAVLAVDALTQLVDGDTDDPNVEEVLAAAKKKLDEAWARFARGSKPSHGLGMKFWS